jgi:Tol biopolymer transport system component
VTVFDRTGKAIGQIGPPGDYRGIDLSPDATRVAVHQHVEPGGDIWVLDSQRGTNSRFTFDASRHFAKPVWSADGTRILYAATAGKFGIFEKPSGGGGSEQTLLEGGGSNQGPTSLSQDGRFVLYTLEGKARDIWALPLFGDRKPFPVFTSEFNEDGGTLSADGRWIAYQSNESGRFEVYVQPFPPSGGKWQISTNGGDQPRWRGDGKELFYLDAARKLMAVEVRAEGNQFSPGVPKTLFDSRASGGGGGSGLGVTYSLYAPARSGDRFIVVTGGQNAVDVSPLTVVLDWATLLKK